MKKIYSKFTKERDRRFQIETAIYVTEDGKKAISKRALLPEGQEHIDGMEEDKEDKADCEPSQGWEEIDNQVKG